MKVQQIAACLDARLDYRPDIRAFLVHDGNTRVIYQNAYVAAMQFGFAVIRQLYTRIEKKPEWEHPSDAEAVRFYDKFEGLFEVFDGEQ